MKEYRNLAIAFDSQANEKIRITFIYDKNNNSIKHSTHIDTLWWTDRMLLFLIH